MFCRKGVLFCHVSILWALVDLAWCKSGTRTPGPRTSGPRDPLQSLKVGPPHLSLMNSFLFRIFHCFFIFVSFLNKDIYKKNINCELTLVKYIWKQKNYLKKLNRTPVNSNPIEVIILLDRHRLAILSDVYLQGTIAIFKFPRERSNERLWVGI